MGPTRPVVRKAFAIVCSLRRVDLPSPPCAISCGHKREPTVWAEWLFVDPVADIAALGTPDSQALSDQAVAYDEL